MSRLLTAMIVLALALPGVVMSATPTVYKNCAAMNVKYPHGVGKEGAHDKTTGKRVTNFKRNAKLYLANKARDRDHDGIACEKS